MRLKSSEQQTIQIPLSDLSKKKRKKNLPEKTGLSGQKHVARQIFRNARNGLKIRVRLKLETKELSGYTEGISPEGMLLISDTALRVGTPLTLQCSFGEVCYRNISGQVVSCQAKDNRNHLVGIKFSALRDWEQKILDSAIQELQQSLPAQKKSLLTILVSEDLMALEATTFYVQARRPWNEEPNPIRKSCAHASKIIGWGSYLPPNEITNWDINSLLALGKDRTRFGDVIGNLTGIKTRRYAGSQVYPSDLAVEASGQALKQAGVDPKDLDVIISCGVARDVEEPATACIIQEKLGAQKAYVFDLGNACNGFISAVDVLDSFIASGRCEIGLVAVGEVISQFINWTPESKNDLRLSAMGYTLGDGGGAAVISRVGDGDVRGIKARWFLSDSSYWRVAVVPLANHSEGLFFRCNGAEIERAALQYVPVGVKETMKMLDWDVNELDLVIPHQVSSHIIENLFFKRLNMPREKVFWSFPNHGNVGAASMPVALCEAQNKGQANPGDKILLVGGSGGFGVGVIALIL